MKEMTSVTKPLTVSEVVKMVNKATTSLTTVFTEIKESELSAKGQI